MTKEEFFAELAKIKGWVLHKNYVGINLPNAQIKKVDDNELYHYCPICAMAKIKLGKEYFNFSFRQAGQALGLEEDFVDSIVRSADGVGPAQIYREELLKLCQKA